MKEEIKKRIEQIRRGEVPKGYRRTKAGVVPESWSMHCIGDCLEKVEKPVTVDAHTLYTQIGIRSHGKGLFHKEPISGEALGNKSVFWVEPNCFVVNIVFAWERAIGKTSENENGMIGSHRFPMYHPRDAKIDIDFLIAYLLTKRGTDILEAASPGGAGRNRTLGQDRFFKSRIILPTLQEQQKIDAILSTQDKVIELKEKLLLEKRRQKKYLCQHILSGKNRLKGFSTKWKKKSISDLCYCLDNMRKPINSSERESLKGKYPYYGANGIVDYINDYIFDDYLILLAEDGGNFEDYSNTPIAIWVSEKCWVNNHAHVLKPMACYDSKFVFYSLEHKDVRKFINGTTRSKLTQGDMLQIAIWMPEDIKEQKVISDILSVADCEIALLQKDIAAEKQKKKALTQLLLTGIVRVKI